MTSRFLIAITVALSFTAAAKATEGPYRIAIVELTGQSSDTLTLDCRLGLECSAEISIVIDGREEDITITAKPKNGVVSLWAQHATRNLRLDQGAARISVNRGKGGATVSLGEFPGPQNLGSSLATPLVAITPVTRATFRIEVRALGARPLP